MSEQYYIICFDDPALPSICSGEKMYVGTLEEIKIVMNRLLNLGGYEETVTAWQNFCLGDTKATHNVAYRNVPLLTPVEYVCATELSTGKKSWEHKNTWGFPYYMQISGSKISEVVIKHNDEYIRLIRAWLNDLFCDDGLGAWMPLKDGFWGNSFLMDVCEKTDNSFTVNNLLYVVEDSHKILDDYEEILLVEEKLKFDKICDEIFADG